MPIIKDNEIDLITVIKTNKDEFDVAFLEWYLPENTETVINWSMERNIPNDTNYILESKPFIKTYKLEKSYSEYNNDIISNIKKLCSINKDSDLICEQELSINIKFPELIIRKLILKIRQTCEIIRQDSRISQGDKIITNKKLGEILILNKEFAPDVLSSVFIDEKQEDDIVLRHIVVSIHKDS